MFIPVRSSYRDLIPCIIKCVLYRLNHPLKHPVLPPLNIIITI